jgi:lactate racemase
VARHQRVTGAARSFVSTDRTSGFYKVESIVADGGASRDHAPLREISTTLAILEIGYHCRDYFVKQWDRFEGMHWGDLAHSTHLRGTVTSDELAGSATASQSLSPPGSPRTSPVPSTSTTLSGRGRSPGLAADPDTLVVPDAGENLYRLR